MPLDFCAFQPVSTFAHLLKVDICVVLFPLFQSSFSFEMSILRVYLIHTFVTDHFCQDPVTAKVLQKNMFSSLQLTKNFRRYFHHYGMDILIRNIIIPIYNLIWLIYFRFRGKTS